MTDALENPEAVTRRSLDDIQRRFNALQQMRLKRVRDDLHDRQRRFLDLIPLLLHINHPMLPGFVSTTTPCGIANYQISNEHARLARGMFHGFDYQRRAHHRYWILGLYLMGSVGSIAYSRRSDLDFWVCHHPDLGEGDIAQLAVKLEKLEEYADEIGLEIHFFPMNLDQFRRGEIAALSRESSGSTQHMLLLEEFYRSGLFLAGNPPLWWFVPPGAHVDYNTYARNLFDRRLLDPNAVLDFGELQQVSPDEFFGSALWQLYKGIDSPYKSLLKVLLTEAHAATYPDIGWVCDDLKIALYGENPRLDELDAYLLMYLRVERYLSERKEPARLDLARRCLYFKTETPLSRRQGGAAWRRELLEKLTTSWHWSKATLVLLDGRDHWKVLEVMQEQELLVRELTRSYRLLVAFARRHGSGQRVDPRELRILGRKLYASLEPRPGKIDRINPGISKDLAEPGLSLHLTQDRIQLFLGNPGEAQLPKLAPVKESLSLVEVLTWAQLNGLVDPLTLLRSYLPRPQMSELQGIRTALAKFFPDRSPFKASMQALDHEPRLKRCAFIVNSEGLPGNGGHNPSSLLISDRSDPLSFSTKRICLVRSVEQVYTTSWGEVFCLRHQGPQALPDALVRYLRLAVDKQSKAPLPPAESFCFNDLHGEAINRRLRDLFRSLAEVYGPDGSGRLSRYLLPMGACHYLIYHDGEHYAWRHLADSGQLYAALAEPMSHYSPIVPDPMALTDSPLATICSHRDPGQMQLFYLAGRSSMDCYVVDEQGSIFYQRLNDAQPNYMLIHLYRFLNSLLERRGLSNNWSMEQLLGSHVGYYRLRPTRDGGWGVDAQPPPVDDLGENVLQLRLTDAGQNEQEQILLGYGSQRFSSAEYGDAIYTKVVEHILSFRRERQSYPIYLSGIEPEAILSEREWQTMRLLTRKRAIEQRLNQELQRVLGG